GTMANTGEATSPRLCASIGSFVAAAYSASRSRATSNGSSSVHLFRPVSSKARSSDIKPAASLDRCQRVELGQRLVELFGTVLLHSLTQRPLDQGTAEIAADAEPRP